MRGLVLIARLSVFGCLPAGSAAAADDHKNLLDICAGPDKDRAISACSDIINGTGLANSDKAGFFIYRAVAYFSKGKYDLAISDAGSAIDLSPDLAEAFELRAVSYLKKGDADRALADCDRAMALKPAAADVFLIRGRVHFARGDYDLAITDHTKAIALNPASAEALRSGTGLRPQRR